MSTISRHGSIGVPPLSNSSIQTNDRVTVACTLTFEHRGDQPVQAAAVYDYLTFSQGVEPYTRRIEATEQWTKLDTGWVTEPGTVIIQSLVGSNLAVHPSPEEAQRMARKILLVSFSESAEQAFRVPPRGMFYGQPTGDLFVRCEQGEANYRLTIFPK